MLARRTQNHRMLSTKALLDLGQPTATFPPSEVLDSNSRTKYTESMQHLQIQMAHGIQVYRSHIIAGCT